MDAPLSIDELRRDLDRASGVMVAGMGATLDLDKIIGAGRRRRRRQTSLTAGGTLGSFALVLMMLWWMVPIGGDSRGSHDASAALTAQHSSVPNQVASADAPGNSGVPNADWPTASVLGQVAARVTAATGGVVVAKNVVETFYGPPLRYDSSSGRAVWASDAPMKSRLVQFTVQAKGGDFLVDVSVEGNAPDSATFWDPKFDLCLGSSSKTCQTVERGANDAVFAYANEAFPERRNLDAWIWRADGLLMHVTVLNYGAETAGAKRPVGPDWQKLGLNGRVLLGAATT